MPGSPLERGRAGTAGGSQRGPARPAPVTPDPTAALLGRCFPRPVLGALSAKSGPRSRGSTPERTGHFPQVPALEKGRPRTEGEGSGWRGAAGRGVETQQGSTRKGAWQSRCQETQRDPGARTTARSLQQAGRQPADRGEACEHPWSSWSLEGQGPHSSGCTLAQSHPGAWHHRQLGKWGGGAGRAQGHGWACCRPASHT